MTEELRKKLPQLYAQEKLGGEEIAYTKYFTPDSSWTWYATEFDKRRESLNECRSCRLTRVANFGNSLHAQDLSIVSHADPDTRI